jgi:hypothetical protein
MTPRTKPCFIGGKDCRKKRHSFKNVSSVLDWVNFLSLTLQLSKIQDGKATSIGRKARQNLTQPKQIQKETNQHNLN